MGWGFQEIVVQKGGGVPPLRSVQTRSEAHPIPYSVGYQWLFPPLCKATRVKS